jgi:hypothetical protein
VDSFNLPFYSASPEEMAGLIEGNGYFSIERMELTNPPATWLKGPVDIRTWIMHVTAAMEGIFMEHFGREIMDEMFERLIAKLSHFSAYLESRSQEKVQLFLVLKRI